MDNEKPKKYKLLNRVIVDGHSQEINPDYVDYLEKRIKRLEERERLCYELHILRRTNESK